MAQRAARLSRSGAMSRFDALFLWRRRRVSNPRVAVLESGTRLYVTHRLSARCGHWQAVTLALTRCQSRPMAVGAERR